MERQLVTPLHWVDGPWPGRLALAARPRGGDWLEDEIAGWQRASIDTVCSLLALDEEAELDLTQEAQTVQAHGMTFVSLPMPDGDIPASSVLFSEALARLDAELTAGRNVVLHCRQGIGRTGLVAMCLLIKTGLGADTAIQRVSKARKAAVPETQKQRQWIENYGATIDDRRI